MLIDPERKFQYLMDIDIPNELQDFVDIEDKLWDADISDKEELIKDIKTFVHKYPKRESYIAHLIDYISQRKYKLMSFYADILIAFFKNFNELPLSVAMVQILASRGIVVLPSKMDSISENDFISIFPVGDIRYALVWDDVDFLTDIYAKDPCFDFGGSVNATSYISIAARNAAVKCFKFLMQNGGNIDDMVCNFAIRGGSVEIVRLCQQSGLPFIGGFIAALQSHHHDIADFMLQEFQCHRPDIASCLTYYNTRAALFFVLNGDDVNAPNANGEIPLMRCCSTNQYEFASYLIKHCNADVNIVDFSTSTPLMAAIKSTMDTSDLIHLLIENNANVNSTNSYGETPLMLALGISNFNAMKILLETHKCDLNQIDQKGITVLMRAAQNGNEDAVNLLIQNGAEVDFSNELGYTALHYALIASKFDVARLLIDNKASVDNIDRTGMSELSFHIKNGSVQTSKFLIDNGVNFETNEKQPPLILAVKSSKYDIAHYIIDSKRCNLNQKDFMGRTALIYASINAPINVVKWLIENGANVDEKDESGITALLYALKHKNEGAALLLIDNNCDIHTKTGNGKSCILLAIEMKSIKIVKKLIEKGMLKDNTDEKQKCIEIARKYKCHEIEDFIEKL